MSMSANNEIFKGCKEASASRPMIVFGGRLGSTPKLDTTLNQST